MAERPAREPMDRFRTRLKSLELDARSMGLEFTAYLLGVVALSLDEQEPGDNDGAGSRGGEA